MKPNKRGGSWTVWWVTRISPILWEKVRRGIECRPGPVVPFESSGEREREIQNFVTKEYWRPYCQPRGKKKVHSFDAKLSKWKGKEASMAQ